MKRNGVSNSFLSLPFVVRKSSEGKKVLLSYLRFLFLRHKKEEGTSSHFSDCRLFHLKKNIREYPFSKSSTVPLPSQRNNWRRPNSHLTLTSLEIVGYTWRKKKSCRILQVTTGIVKSMVLQRKIK